jgi:hypothetical protein
MLPKKYQLEECRYPCMKEGRPEYKWLILVAKTSLDLFA